MPAEAPTPPEKVLLVEDRQSFADEISAMLEGSGIEMTHVTDLEAESCQVLLRQNWMCVLLGLNVPPHEGASAVAKARELTTNSVIVLTGLNGADYGVVSVQAGADDYLLKHSVTKESLIGTIRVASARHIRRLNENQEAAHLQAQMKVLLELAGLMTSIRDMMKPKPVFRGFFTRVATAEGRKEIEEQIRGAGWFVGKILFEVAAVFAAIWAAIQGSGLEISVQ